MASNGQLVLSTSYHLMSVEVMKGVIWGGFVLCFVAFCARSWIRWVCFRRFMPEDWIMLIVLGMILASAIVAQLRLHYVYMMEDVGNGLIPMPPTFMEDVPKALLGVFAQGLLGSIGVYAVKLSFLLFFYRLGNQITSYLVFWWCVALVTLASFGVTMGLLEYKCMLSGLEVIFFECTSKTDIAREWRNMIIYCTLDAFSDVLILCLPIALLWNIRLTMRKRLLLSAVFSLTLFTVAVTIIRGTIHHGRIASDFTQSMNIGWVWFWLSVEFFTAYIIACLVSFRMLFVRNEKSSSARVQAYRNQQQFPAARPSGSGQTPKKFLDSLLDTFHSWEGTTRHSRDDFFLNGTLPSGRMSVDFMQYEASVGGWPLVDQNSTRPGTSKTLTNHEVHQVASSDSVKYGERIEARNF